MLPTFVFPFVVGFAFSCAALGGGGAAAAAIAAVVSSTDAALAGRVGGADSSVSAISSNSMRLGLGLGLVSTLFLTGLEAGLAAGGSFGAGAGSSRSTCIPASSKTSSSRVSSLSSASADSRSLSRSRWTPRADAGFTDPADEVEDERDEVFEPPPFFVAVVRVFDEGGTAALRAGCCSSTSIAAVEGGFSLGSRAADTSRAVEGGFFCGLGFVFLTMNIASSDSDSVAFLVVFVWRFPLGLGAGTSSTSLCSIAAGLALVCRLAFVFGTGTGADSASISGSGVGASSSSTSVAFDLDAALEWDRDLDELGFAVPAVERGFDLALVDVLRDRPLSALLPSRSSSSFSPIVTSVYCCGGCFFAIFPFTFEGGLSAVGPFLLAGVLPRGGSGRGVSSSTSDTTSRAVLPFTVDFDLPPFREGLDAAEPSSRSSWLSSSCDVYVFGAFFREVEEVLEGGAV